jgi:hypothetical protein
MIFYDIYNKLCKNDLWNIYNLHLNNYFDHNKFIKLLERYILYFNIICIVWYLIWNYYTYNLFNLHNLEKLIIVIVN